LADRSALSHAFFDEEPAVVAFEPLLADLGATGLELGLVGPHLPQLLAGLLNRDIFGAGVELAAGVCCAGGAVCDGAGAAATTAATRIAITMRI
jgi:hypothetical protein